MVSSKKSGLFRDFARAVGRGLNTGLGRSATITVGALGLIYAVAAGDPTITLTDTAKVILTGSTLLLSGAADFVVNRWKSDVEYSVPELAIAAISAATAAGFTTSILT